MEVEQEDYKEAGGATAKAAQGTDPKLLEELASIKAMVKKSLNAQQNSQQNPKKQGDGKRDANNNPSGKKKKNDTCHGCGGTGHFVKDCPNPHKSSLNSKRGKERQGPPPLLPARRKLELQLRKRTFQQKKNRPKRMGQNRPRT